MSENNFQKHYIPVQKYHMYKRNTFQGNSIAGTVFFIGFNKFLPLKNLWKQL